MKIRIAFIGFICLTFLFACKKKETELQEPTISFKTGSQYTQTGAVIEVGHPLFFGIQAKSDDSDLTNFTIKKRFENGTEITVMDTALYSKTLNIDKRFFQNVEPKVTWVFAVMDRKQMKAEVTLEVLKDPNSQFGGIYYYPSIKMGFQNNFMYGQFLDPLNGQTYKVDSAFLFQNHIDFLSYYINADSPPGPCLSSPGEIDNFSTEAQTFYPTITTWGNRNYTLWDISVDATPIPISAFDAAQNDSLLIVSYNEVWGRKKFRWATTGRVIPFKTASGKFGLVKVLYNDSNDAGYIEIALKIQQ